MKELTSHERFSRMYAHQEADRCPVTDYPWAATLERWRSEGLPTGADYNDFCGLDKIAHVRADNGPRYPERVVEETADYVIYTSSWGVTSKQWKHAASTPEFLDFTVVDPASWEQARRRMTPDSDRVDWAALERDYPKWRKEGWWIEAGLWFGFDVTHSWFVGTERVLYALVEQPDWCAEMFNHELDVHLKLLEQIWDKGYHFDTVEWPDDMGYKGHQFFSLDLYRRLLKPVHQRAADWAHNRGVKVRLHSCGDVRPFLPEFLEIGIDALNPLEVKAGMDPAAIKKQYGGKLVLHGGINAVLWDDLPAIEAEMRRVLPALKENGGYIFSSDHSVPSSVSLQGFQRIVSLAKELTKYGY